MATPVNPFTPAELEKYKQFFLPSERKGFPTAAELEAERSGLASFLGTTDYTKQLADAQGMGKLQLALALAQHGFAAAGATPVRGETPVSTLSRELFSPLARDAGAAASQMIARRQALKDAERQEERQLKLAALQNVQKRQEQAYAADATATQQARQFILMSQKKGAKVSDAFTVKGEDGKFFRQPVIIETDWLGNIIYRNASGDKIPDNKIGIYTKPDVIKPSLKQVTDIEALVIGPSGERSWEPIPATLTTTFNNDGSVNTSVLTESTTHTRLITSGEKQNARKAPKAGSTTSNYYPPGKGTPIFLTETFVQAFGLPDSLIGAKAELQRLVPKPDVAKTIFEATGKDLKEIQKVHVSGRTYNLQDHRGYNKDTGNIDLDTEEGKVTLDASGLWRLEDPKAFTPAGAFVVPGGDRLAEINKIPGLGSITAGERLNIERNPAGQERIRHLGQTITLTAEQAQLFQTRDLSTVERIEEHQEPVVWTSRGELVVSPENLEKIQKIPGLSNITAGDTVTLEEDRLGNWRALYLSIPIALDDNQVALFQGRPLSETQRIEAGHVLEPKTAFVNTSNRTLQIGDQTVGAGQIGYFTKTDQASKAFMDASNSFREVGPVDTAAKVYMFKEERKIGEVEYVPGDEIRYSPQEFENLPDNLKIALTDDTALRATTLKKKYFEAIWENVRDINKELALPGNAAPSPRELATLLGMFPAGMRSGGKNLRDEIFRMIKYGKYGVGQENQRTDALINTDQRASSYAQLVADQMIAARERYEGYLAIGALPPVPWDSLSFERQRAFADLKTIMQPQNVEPLWEKAVENLAKDKAAFTHLDQDDVASYAATAELLILAKYLRDHGDLSDTGAFFGWWGDMRAGVFADITPITSGGTQRLRSIINAMKSRYATLAGQEGEGRPSDFRVGLQQELIPAFTKAAALNENNLDIMIERLETTMRSAFTPTIMHDTVIPQNFEAMAAEAGVTGKTNPKLYRWVDPSVSGPTPVTRAGVLGQVLGVIPFTFGDALELDPGQQLPPTNVDALTGAKGVVYVKIKNNDDGTVTVQELGGDGRPNKDAPEVKLTPEAFGG